MIFESLNSKKVRTSLVASVATLALAACGDKGKNAISACPAGYTIGGKQLTAVPEAQRSLQKGVAELRTHMPAIEDAVRIASIDLKYIGAAQAVFNRSSSDHFLNVSQETRVDDTSEVFCHGAQADEIFFSPQADAAIGALASAGIKVE